MFARSSRIGAHVAHPKGDDSRAKRLPLDKLTPAIIRRALVDLQFNLSDQALLRRYALKSRK